MRHMLQRQKWRNRREIRVQVVPREDLGEAALMITGLKKRLVDRPGHGDRDALRLPAGVTERRGSLSAD